MKDLTQEQINIIEDEWNNYAAKDGKRYLLVELSQIINRFEDDDETEQGKAFNSMSSAQEIEFVKEYISLFDEDSSSKKAYKLAHKIKESGNGKYPIADLFKYLYMSKYEELLKSFELTPDQEKQLLNILVDIY